jgi:methylated-DNA-[protein]-cysteine S-methyltransferase
MDLLIDRVESELGTILLVSDGENLCALDYGNCTHRMTALLQRRYGQFRLRDATDPQGFSSRIRAYLARCFTAIDDIPVSPGGTPFQQQIWSALRAIPLGTTISYSEMATQLGKPTAYRAVGMANGLNPVAIVIPCHRMIGANGALTGYAGGLTRKRWLLQHEGIRV